jgi:hypothetical protein
LKYLQSINSNNNNDSTSQKYIRNIIHVSYFTSFLILNASIPLSLLQAYHQLLIVDYEKNKVEKRKREIIKLKKKKMKKIQFKRKKIDEDEEEDDDDNDDIGNDNNNSADEEEDDDEKNEDNDNNKNDIDNDDLFYENAMKFSFTPSPQKLFIQGLVFYLLFISFLNFENNYK